MWDSSSPCLWESCSSVSMLRGPHERQCHSWGLQLWAGNTEVTTSHRGKTTPHQLHEGRMVMVVRCRLPVVMQKLHRAVCVQPQATSFSATIRAKSAIQAKREWGGWREGNKKQQITYPQSIQLIVPRPFTSWATLDSNLSELSAAAAGRNKKKVTNSIITPQRRIQWCIPLF